MSYDLVAIGNEVPIGLGIEEARNATLTGPFVQFIAVGVSIRNDGFVVLDPELFEFVTYFL
jgi:hypothetical protein